MKLIAHRGNLEGPNLDKENHPDYINFALKAKYDVEIDVWSIDGGWYLGHDGPLFKVKYDYLTSDRMWLHAKNIDALYHLLSDRTCNVFYHTDEDWVLTSKKYIWTYPNNLLYPNSICVLPERGYNGEIKDCFGICTDYVLRYKSYA